MHGLHSPGASVTLLKELDANITLRREQERSAQALDEKTPYTAGRDRIACACCRHISGTLAEGSLDGS